MSLPLLCHGKSLAYSDWGFRVTLCSQTPCPPSSQPSPCNFSCGSVHTAAQGASGIFARSCTGHTQIWNSPLFVFNFWMFLYLFCFHFCCCGKIPRHKSNSVERVYFSSRFWVSAYYGGALKIAEMNTASPSTPFVKNRERWLDA